MKPYRHPYIHVSSAPDLPDDTLVQPKLDGWYAMIEIDTSIRIYSRTGTLLLETQLVQPLKNSRFYGEVIYGTNRACQSPFHGSTFIFDAELIGGYGDVRHWPYHVRIDATALYLKRVNLPFLYVIPQVSYSDWKIYHSFKTNYKIENITEGFIFREPRAKFDQTVVYRHKYEYSMDYVCCGINEGGGRLHGKMGSITGGLYVNGSLVSVVSVGGGFSDAQREEIFANKDQYIGRVFEAHGWQVFPGGSLRHPNFSRWRDDKNPEDCREVV